MMDEVEYDYYTSLATLYDKQDLRQPYLQHTMPSSNSQRIGAIAETRFVTECLERDFEPHTPTTPMPWDYIVHCSAGDLKVQVKSTTTKHQGKYYSISTGSGTSTKEHMSDLVDVVACYAAPIDTWWMIPRASLTTLVMKLYDDNTSKSKYKKYQNNWSIYYE
jgi:hypothetical protein